MRHVGIICEYNPLHEGHVRLLRAVRENGAGTVICLLGGNFTQRGEAALFPPSVRAGAAIAAGADLVLELPFPASCGSASYFAAAGVRALRGVGADTVAFGSECADLPKLTAAAKRLLAADLKEADPAAGAAAEWQAVCGAFSSNDILGVSYIAAALAEDLPLDFFPVLRVGDAYLEETPGAVPSAAAIRKRALSGEDFLPLLPEFLREIYEDALRKTGFSDISRLGTAMLARLRSGEDLSGIADCGGGLAARLCRAAMKAEDYASLLAAAATRKYTDGRIRRALLYCLAGVRREDLEAPPAYLRLLAANGRGRAYLAEKSAAFGIPVVSAQREAKALGAGAERQRALSLVSDGLYALCFGKGVTPHALQTAAPHVSEN